MNPFNRVVDVHCELFGNLDVLPRPYTGKVAAYKRVEFVSEKLVEYLQILMKIRRNIKSLERSIASRYAVNGHQEFGLRDIDEEIAFIRVIVMAGELDSLTSKRKRLRGVSANKARDSAAKRITAPMGRAPGQSISELAKYSRKNCYEE